MDIYTTLAEHLSLASGSAVFAGITAVVLFALRIKYPQKYAVLTEIVRVFLESYRRKKGGKK